VLTCTLEIPTAALLQTVHVLLKVQKEIFSFVFVVVSQEVHKVHGDLPKICMARFLGSIFRLCLELFNPFVVG
jgi:hypothetical protein